MEGSADGLDAVDIVAMPRASGLSAENRRHVYNALVNSRIDGWTPDRESVLRLIDFAAGRIDVTNKP